MADFSHLTALAVTKETTREYVFDQIMGEPSLVVSPATDDNQDFLHARLELALEEVPDETPKPRRQVGKPTVAELERQYAESRDLDRRVIAKACVRGWGSSPPVDKDGKKVAFSPEEALSFLSALPDYMFDPFRNWVQNVRNFTPKQKPRGDQMGES